MSRKTTKIKRRGLRNVILGACIAKMIGSGKMAPLPKAVRFTWEGPGKPWMLRALDPDPRP